MANTGVAARPMLGETVSGDGWVIMERPTEAVIAIIDGLGHGPEAHAAAEKARAAFIANAELPLTNIMRAMHTATLSSRGVVAGLLQLCYHDHRAHYVGVGNTGIYVISQHAIQFISRNGTVGYRLPALFAQTATYTPGDTFILFSDGVSMQLVATPLIRQGLPPQTLADRLLHTYGKTDDDATVVVVQAPMTLPDEFMHD